MRGAKMKNKKKAVGITLLSLMFMSPILSSCTQESSSSVAVHECVFYPVEAVASTCKTQGHKAYEECPYCRKKMIDGQVVTDEEVLLPLDPKNHDSNSLTTHPGTPATCLTDGTKEYSYCADCGSYVIDGENYTEENYQEALVIPKETAEHELVHHDEVASTCIPGKKAYDQCSVCHKYFIDGVEVQESDLIIPASGEHNFNTYGVCENGCGTYRYDSQVFDSTNLVPLTATSGDGYCDTGDDKIAMIESIHDTKMTFHTQRSSKDGCQVTYRDGEAVDITLSKGTANQCSFTRFVVGDGQTAYTGQFYLTFEITIDRDMLVDRLGAMIADYDANVKTDTLGEYDQSNLLGADSGNKGSVEKNPNRILKGNTTYRFIYKMETTNTSPSPDMVDKQEQMIQIFIGGGDATYTLSNLHVITLPEAEKTGKVTSSLLYFGETDLVENEKDIKVTDLTLNKTYLTMQVGDEETLVATVLPDIATDKTVTWSSDHPEIVDVDDNGKLTAKTTGTAKITATCGGLTATCDVEVLDMVIPVTGVELDKETLELTAGDDASQLVATITPDNASNKTLTWSSSAPEVASVSDTGLVTPLTEGQTTITVKTNDGLFEDTCVVTVSAPTEKHYYTYLEEDFFDPANWDANGEGARDDSIIDSDFKLSFTSSTASRFDLFYGPNHANFAENSNNIDGTSKDQQAIFEPIYNQTYSFDMDVETDGEVNLMIFGTSGANGPTNTSSASLYLHIKSDGSMSLDQSAPMSNNDFKDHFTCADTGFKLNETNKLSFKVNRVDINTLTLQVFVNDKQVKFEGDDWTQGSRGTYSVDENGTYTSNYVKGSGYGPRFGVYPSADTAFKISSLAIDPEPEQITEPDPEPVEKHYNLYNGKDFFDPANWYGTTQDQIARDDSIIDEDHNLSFTDATPSRTDFFYFKDAGCHFGEKNAENKWNGYTDYYGITYTFSLGIESTGAFEMTAIANKSWVTPSTTEGFGFSYHFEDNKISLTCHHGADNYTFTANTDAFKYNQVNQVSLKVTRVDADTLTLQLLVNDAVVEFDKSGDYPGSSYSFTMSDDFVLSFDKYLAKNGYGQRLGIFPDAGSVVTISSLAIDPAPAN